MTHDVVWLPEAELALAAIWLHASDRQVITAAAHAIDQRLRLNPEPEGESRPNGRRIAFAKPPGVLFRVSRNDRRVQVLHVWSY